MAKRPMLVWSCPLYPCTVLVRLHCHSLAVFSIARSRLLYVRNIIELVLLPRADQVLLVILYASVEL